VDSASASFAVRLVFSTELIVFTREPERTKQLREKTSIKDVIESCGVPHPEVDLILIAGEPVGFAHQLTAENDVQVYGTASSLIGWNQARLQTRQIHRFVADGHLGKLTRDLRLLGIDVAYNPIATDAQLLATMADENRALLTRDRRLLMHSVVQHGYFPRSQVPVEQTREVLRRFDLSPVIAPYTRCLRCNATIAHVPKSIVDAQLEPLTRAYYDEFRRCTGCSQIYWSGSHFEKLQARVRSLLEP
jgi:uncharacterized protein